MSLFKNIFHLYWKKKKKNVSGSLGVLDLSIKIALKDSNTPERSSDTNVWRNDHHFFLSEHAVYSFVLLFINFWCLCCMHLLKTAFSTLNRKISHFLKAFWILKVSTDASNASLKMGTKFLLFIVYITNFHLREFDHSCPGVILFRNFKIVSSENL